MPAWGPIATARHVESYFQLRTAQYYKARVYALQSLLQH